MKRYTEKHLKKNLLYIFNIHRKYMPENVILKINTSTNNEGQNRLSAKE
jgi:hypothetical protein